MAFVATGRFIDPMTNRKTYQIEKVEVLSAA